jgi:transcription elongation factor Elf1
MKHNIEWIVCSNCGAHIYPPVEVSDMGIEDYEEIFEAPSVEPERLPSDAELAEINRARREAGLPEFASVGEWVAYYRDWAVKFRADRRAMAQARCDELSGEPPKLRGLTVVEELKAFKVIGKRWRAVYEETSAGWRLKCPRCNSILLEWMR